MTQSLEFQRLIDDARTQLPGSLVSAIRAELFACVKDFLDQTNVWYEKIDVPIVANTRTYTLTSPTQGRIIRLLNLYVSTDVDEKPCSPVRMDQPGVIILGQTPGASATWVAKVAKTVKDPVDADGNPDIPAWLVEKYWDCFAHGVYSGMHAQGGKPYSNPNMALFRRRQYLKLRNEARIDAIKGNVIGQATWAFPQTWGRGSQRMGR